ncbi:MAG: hypothetical protein U5K75_10275 [Ahrensia sp.]|nr:hypothetical protein [Ahrensia sp.]
MMVWFRCIYLFVFASAALSGCASISYLEQSASGHFNILAARKNVAKLADDETQPAALRNQMSLAREIDDNLPSKRSICRTTKATKPMSILAAIM